MGECFGGLEEKSQATAGGTGVWGRNLQNKKNFAFFYKNNLILEIFSNKLLLLKRGIEIGISNIIKHGWLMIKF